ncbi:hypothetical protein J2Z69_000798 [Paenibacillus shirakamiensis]|uniref:Uncharacterized protein n=1 Tax=Paenibacillus shirakamiensis TaxID=1265935 RepID=A0ABS4JDH9_9BACL|nr:hypothetical protein [Paenibacillus shirakamiensis]MBP1999779.1 hypothetical protein [Paenibacillus shirakamiensis]
MWFTKIGNLLKHHRVKEMALEEASERVTISINRYRAMSKDIQSEIKRNHFAKHLVYQKQIEHEVSDD